MKIYMALAAMILAAGCASKSENIQASYMSPVIHEGYSCEQLAQEGQRVSARAAQAAGVQDMNRQNDTIKTTVGVIFSGRSCLPMKEMGKRRRNWRN